MNIIFIAPPAAGKGTHSSKLVEDFGYIHISTGELLRKEAKVDSDTGRLIRKLMNDGTLVSDEIITELLRNELVKLTGDNHFVIDGYPRNLKQAEELNSLLKEININNFKVIYLNVDEEIATKRTLGRLTCESCGTTFNKMFDNFKPSVEGICDKCGQALVCRADDTAETFKKRYQTYIELTQPIIEYYKNLGVLYEVDSNCDSNDSFEKIKKIVRLK